MPVEVSGSPVRMCLKMCQNALLEAHAAKAAPTFGPLAAAPGVSPDALGTIAAAAPSAIVIPAAAAGTHLPSAASTCSGSPCNLCVCTCCCHYCCSAANAADDDGECWQICKLSAPASITHTYSAWTEFVA